MRLNALCFCFYRLFTWGWRNDEKLHYIKKKKVVSRQPIFIVNLKSNTMKNTVQR
jgi:hypothetical protein